MAVLTRHSGDLPDPTLVAKALDQLVAGLLGALPNAPGANYIKALLMKGRGARVGSRLKVWTGFWADRFDRLEIGDDVTIGKSVILIGAGGVTVGHRVMVGHGSKLISVGHRVPPGRGPMRFSGPVYGRVSIGDDAWLGAQVLLLPGVTVGEGAIVAAGAVVTKEVPPYALVGGVPARIIRMRE